MMHADAINHEIGSIMASRSHEIPETMAQIHNAYNLIQEAITRILSDGEESMRNSDRRLLAVIEAVSTKREQPS